MSRPPALVAAVALVWAVSANADARQPVVFATVVASGAHERSAATLVESIRAFAGPHKNAPVYIAVDDPEQFPCARAAALGATVVPLEMPATATRYPFAHKAFAAAQVEALVAGSADTLVWMDAETLILAPPANLVLADGVATALKPVFKMNTIGQAPDAVPDTFWGPIYEAAGVDPATLPGVEIFSTGEVVRAYYNCEVIAFDPEHGICREWARLFTRFVEDADYQAAACPDALHKIFLHQAVLSAVIVARTSPPERHALPPSCGYPLNLHDELGDDRRIARLDGVEAVIYEDTWDRRTDFLDIAPASDELRAWLADAWLRRLAVSDRIYRDEHDSNSYLVLTSEGSVLIDPAGSKHPDSPLRSLVKKHPLKAILLTHAHQDHLSGMASWKGDLDIPVITQRDHVDFIRYDDRLAAFLGRRLAWQQGRVPEVAELEPRETPVEVTVQFTDRHTFELGDLHFEMIHTAGETPDTSLVWIPELAAAFTADNFYTSFPNTYTLRGTRPRWALDYIKALDTAIERNPAMLFPGHGEPVIGKERVRRELTHYRDALAYVHDATVAGMNEGKDVFTLMREIALPEELALPQFFGRVDWSVRGIYEGYAGWFDGEPAHMYAEPESSVYPELLALAGGADAVASRAAEMVESADDLGALHLADIVLCAEPGHRPALEVRLRALRSLRSKSRNYIERNWLLTGIRDTEARQARVDAPE